MVEQTDVLEIRDSFFCGDTNQFMEALIAQRRVRPQCDHEVELFCIVQHTNKCSEQKRQWQRTRVVGDQHQHALACEFSIETLIQGFHDLVIRKCLSFRCNYLRINHNIFCRGEVISPSFGRGDPATTYYTPLNAEKPPSMGITVPVTNAEADEISHRVAPSRSSGVPKRFIGV